MTEVEVRATLERATGSEASVVERRFMIQTGRGKSPWIVIVEPDADASLLIVDSSVSGKPMGVEITAPRAVPLDRLNQLLAKLGVPPLAEQDYGPARAA